MQAPKKVYRVLVRVPKTNEWDGPHLRQLSEISFRMGIAKGHYKVPRDRDWACGLIRDNGLAVFTAFAAFLAAIASIVAAVAALGE